MASNEWYKRDKALKEQTALITYHTVTFKNESAFKRGLIIVADIYPISQSSKPLIVVWNKKYVLHIDYISSF